MTRNDIQRGGFYYHRAEGRRGSESDPHCHSEYEIYYLTEGRCSYFIGERPYDVIPGDVVFIPKGEIHRTNYGRELNGRIVVNFGEELVPPELSPVLSSMPRHYRDKELSEGARRILSLIGEEYGYGDQFSAGALACLVGSLLYMLFRRREGSGAIEDASLVGKVAEYVKENYTGEVRLGALAERFSVSREHLSREFKRSVGLGFSEYLTLYRLRRAKEMLLCEPSRSVAEVAFACGFNDGNYFSHRFKCEYGYPPSELRRREGNRPFKK